MQPEQFRGVVRGHRVAAPAGVPGTGRLPVESVDDLAELRLGEGRVQDGGGFGQGESDRGSHVANDARWRSWCPCEIEQGFLAVRDGWWFGDLPGAGALGGIGGAPGG
jgi:hypothetical protein